MGVGDIVLVWVLGCALLVGASRNVPFAYQNQFQRQCSLTMYPSLCVQILQEFAPSQQGFDVVSLLLNKTISESEKFPLSSFVSTELLESKEDREHIYVTDSCKSFMRMSMKRLYQAIEALDGSSRKQSTKEDIQTWLSAVMTFQQACKDSATAVSGKPSAAVSQISQKMDHLSRLVSNSLALVDKFKEKSNPNPMSAAFRVRWVSAGDRKLLETDDEAAKTKANVVVAKDGSGDYDTVAEAVEAASGKDRFVIYVKAGTYNEKIRIEKDSITLIGDGQDRTVFVGGDSVAGGASMPDSATFTVTGDGFIGRDIGFENTAGPGGQQAIALSIASDRSVLYRCRISSHQDTLYAVALRQFYKECDIYGTIDFIFGNAAAIFQSCNFFIRRPMEDKAYNVILANGRTDPAQNTGFILQNCKIEADSDLLPVKHEYSSYLGRPWKDYSRSVVMETYIDDVIAGKGWIEWLRGESGIVKTLYFAEYANSGPGAEISKRVNWEGFHLIGAEDAESFTVGNFIDGTSWLPPSGVTFISGV